MVTHSRKLYRKLAAIHATKVVQFDWSAMSESF